MTVKKLIEELKEMPEDADVVDVFHEDLQGAYQTSLAYLDDKPLKPHRKVVVIY